MRTRAIIALTAAVSLLAGFALAFGVMQWTRRIPASATVKAVGIGVYKDVDFTISVVEIDWGILEPGEERNYSAYIKNESNVPITLTLHTGDWSPPNASDYITLSWDYNGDEISVNGWTPVIFILTVDPGISSVDTFSFTIVIVGSG